MVGTVHASVFGRLPATCWKSVEGECDGLCGNPARLPIDLCGCWLKCSFRCCAGVCPVWLCRAVSPPCFLFPCWGLAYHGCADCVLWRMHGMPNCRPVLTKLYPCVVWPCVLQLVAAVIRCARPAVELGAWAVQQLFAAACLCSASFSRTRCLQGLHALLWALLLGRTPWRRGLVPMWYVALAPSSCWTDFSLFAASSWTACQGG